MARMKETTAEDLKGKRIRIVSDGIMAHEATFIRLDTNEVIQNVCSARLDWEAGRILSVTLWLVRVDSVAKQMKREAVVVDNPVVDAQSLAYRDEAVNEEAWDTDIWLIRELEHENERLRAEIAKLTEKQVQ